MITQLFSQPLRRGGADGHAAQQCADSLRASDRDADESGPVRLRHVCESCSTPMMKKPVFFSSYTSRSHGSEKHELSVDFRPLRLSTIDPAKLKTALDESGIRWKVIVISACYSGGFIDALKDERTLVITASAADKTSFGCGTGSDATYLAQALFGRH